MKVLVLGTSNCLLAGGLRDAFHAYFGKGNVTNISLGGASGTFQSLFRFIEGVEFSDYDYVFFDSIVNEQWQFAAGGSLEHIRNAARLLYGALPEGVAYVYIGFSIRPNFYRADPIEQMHRSLCSEAGVNFIALRELFVECGGINALPRDVFFPAGDAAHFKPNLVYRFAMRLFDCLPSLPKKNGRATIGRGDFFTQDIKTSAVAREVHSTSLRTQEYGLFTAGSIIVPEQGCFLGFDFVALKTEAFLRIHAEGRSFFKALHFRADRPFMKVAGFYSEVVTGPNSFVEVAAAAVGGEVVETTEATASLEQPLSGEARLSTFYFSHLPASELCKRVTFLERGMEVPLLKVHEDLLNDLQGYCVELRG
jgi:hypothetical protein